MNRNMLFIITFVFSILYTEAALANENSIVANFSGTLLEDQPCTVRPGDDEIDLDFSSINRPYLISEKRTRGFPFTIHLDDCDTMEHGTVKIYFTGAESVNTPGLLAPDRSSITDGIAIGLETMDGILLPVNDPAKSFSLQLEHSTTFNLQAFVQVAEENKVIEGNFHVSANYVLEYD